MENLQYVVGEVSSDRPAVIRLFGKITEESSRCFIDEFLWLENCVKPSAIQVHINSEGGSVLYGMSVYSVIRNSSIRTECIVEGMAASMGSIIWAAGDVSFMRDYSILMVHNPFLIAPGEKEIPEEVKAFRRQIEMIYTKRWGFAKDKVKAIMDGKADKDGTFFTASEAVKAGILPQENVLKTSKQRVETVKNTIEGIVNPGEIEARLMALFEKEPTTETENKPSVPFIATHKRTDIEFTTNKSNTMENEISFHYGAVVASLGMSKDTDVTSVMARIAALATVEGELRTAKEAIDSLKIEKAGEVAKVQNLQQELSEANAKLGKYMAAETAARKSKIEGMVQSAIDQGKIEKETKSTWVEMAEKNFTLAEATLNAIPSREKITEEIAKDPANITAALESVKTAEQRVAEQVKAVLGDDFKLESL